MFRLLLRTTRARPTTHTISELHAVSLLAQSRKKHTSINPRLGHHETVGTNRRQAYGFRTMVTISR